MNIDEQDVRRALDARSAPPSAEFRERLASALSRGPRRADPVPAIASIAAVVLAVAAVGILVTTRQEPAPKGVPATKPSPAATSPSPIPTLTPGSLEGVLNPPPGRIALPADATLSAPSHDVVWALVLSQYLYRSTDDGRTWQQRPLPPFAGQNVEISFISDSEGWLKADGSPETQCNAQSVAIWHTSDAGATWNQLADRGVADAQCKKGFAFTDPSHGFLGASDENHKPVIYFTSDGGASWNASAPLTDPPGFTSRQAGGELAAGRVRRFGSVLVVPVSGYQSGSPVLYVFESNDSGASWAYQAKASNGGGSIGFVSATHWLQLITPGQSAETTDSGNSWHLSTSDYSQAAPIAPEVDFADGQVGYATVRGGIQITVDGGQHWTEIKTPGT